jgi:hypothetical protein
LYFGAALYPAQPLAREVAVFQIVTRTAGFDNS